MPKYAYRAFDGLGRMETGVLEADSERAAVASFQSRGFLVTSLTARDDKDRERPARRLGGYFPIQPPDPGVVTRSLATMASPRVALLSAVLGLAVQSPNRPLRGGIVRLRPGSSRGRRLYGQ